MLLQAPNTQRRVSVLRRRRGGVLGMALGDEEDGLSDSIERELKKRDDPKKVCELRCFQMIKTYLFSYLCPEIV